jgi:GDP-L-fucose synthase
VIPALIRKFHEAKVKNKPFVEVWGSGKPMREFLHVDDMADASIHIMDIDKKILESEVDLQEAKKDKLCEEEGFNVFNYHE